MANHAASTRPDRPLRVLVVEDSPVERDAVARMLRDEGTVVFEAGDGIDALNVLDHETVDLVLLDLRLPHLDGEHLLVRLRRRAATPVIVVSAMQAEADRVRMLDLGADDYVVKPFLARELLARIRAVLRRTGTTTPRDTVAFADLVLDGPSRSAARGGGPRVPLTEQEFTVLRLLVERRGTVVSHDAIEKAIHPDEPSEVSTVVDVVILRLRKKLGRDLIVTRHGQGYIVDG